MIKDYYAVKVKQFEEVYISAGGILLSLFSLRDYCNEFLNEGYNNLDLYKIKEVLIDQGEIVSVQLIKSKFDIDKEIFKINYLCEWVRNDDELFMKCNLNSDVHSDLDVKLDNYCYYCKKETLWDPKLTYSKCLNCNCRQLSISKNLLEKIKYKRNNHLLNELIQVLKFYSNEDNYNQKYRSHFNSEYYDSNVSLDEGEKARKLLARYKL